MLSKIEIETLVDRAIAVRTKAFLVKSDHPVGACLIAEDGQMFDGCNIENYISGLGTCAERAAIDHAVIHGIYKYRAIAIADDSHGFYPCGACLQYLSQFSLVNGEDITIIVSNLKKEYQTYNLSELLPKQFTGLSTGTLEKLKNYNK